ncbi:28S ribosomal protein S5, mitochondrial [Coemansia aciculifera]|uniref:28S ribosomal protein S5, mitochondrial n=1 Tax=Coemansia aciculifera TaxID=417176 RepID=A0ACC1LT49_9FUNG|nr:28S ribosomal protein S5, mitochondrial [Coemansia aciculifera]
MRVFSTGAAAAKARGTLGTVVSAAMTKSFPDFSKFDPVYDDVSENTSVIELWKRQKAQQLGSATMSTSNLEALVNKERNITEAPANFFRRYPKMVAQPNMEEVANADDGMFWSEDLLIPFEQFGKLSKKTLVVKRTTQMTSKGKIPSMYAMVVVGNGMGSAGFGEGKSFEASKAVVLATRQAIKSMQHFPRYDDRTIYHDIEYKFKATKLLLWARRPGFGCRVSPVVHEICECIGIQDLAGKIHGSRNPMNVIKTVFGALQTQRVPDDLARARGLRLLDVYHTYYGGIKPSFVRR